MTTDPRGGFTCPACYRWYRHPRYHCLNCGCAMVHVKSGERPPVPMP